VGGQKFFFRERPHFKNCCAALDLHCVGGDVKHCTIQSNVAVTMIMIYILMNYEYFNRCFSSAVRVCVRCEVALFLLMK